MNVCCHCIGCEELCGADFNLCVECHGEGKYKTKEIMGLCKDLHSGHMHTGTFRCITCLCEDCAIAAKCPKCELCARCCCKCHTNFSVCSRFFDKDGLAKLLKRVEGVGHKRPATYFQNWKAEVKHRKCGLWPICLEDASCCGGCQAKNCRMHQDTLTALPTKEEINRAMLRYNDTDEGREMVEDTKARNAKKRSDGRKRERGD